MECFTTTGIPRTVGTIIDVLHQNGCSGSGEAWLHIDDEVVRTLRHEDMFGSHNNEHVDARCAYMLFYFRIAAART